MDFCTSISDTYSSRQDVQRYAKAGYLLDTSRKRTRRDVILQSIPELRNAIFPIQLLPIRRNTPYTLAVARELFRLLASVMKLQ